MNKDEFINILKDGLKDFPEGELSEILFFYKDFFDSSYASGKNSDDIIKELGNPYEIVEKYLKEKNSSITNESENSYDKVKENPSKEDYITNDKVTSKKTSNNFIISLIILVLSCVVLGPIALGILGVMSTIFIVILASTLGISILGTVILLGKVFTNTIGILLFPTFILDFPNSVIAFSVLGSICLFIFTILLLYCLIKFIVRLIRRIFNWTSSKVKEEK